MNLCNILQFFVDNTIHSEHKPCPQDVSLSCSKPNVGTYYNNSFKIKVFRHLK